MPKRRRKRSSDSKPPLEFEESPVHIVKGVPSPVFCSDNPVTADVVPIEEYSRHVWVSPQFVGDPTPCLRRSRRTRLCSGNATRKSLSFQPVSSRKVRRSIAPLQFIGDGQGSSEAQDASCENLSINEYDVVELAPVKPKRLDVIYSQEDGSGDQKDVEEVDFHNQFDEPGDLCAPEVPADLGTPSYHSDNHPLCPMDAILTPNFEAAPNNNKLAGNVSKNKQDSCNLTQMIPKSHKEKKRKKLLFGSNSDDNKSDEENQSSLGFTVGVDAPLNNCDNNSDNKPVKSRLRERHLLFSNIPDCTPERPKSRNNMKILAYDTPEEDYGLTVRQRIIKKYKKQKKQH